MVEEVTVKGSRSCSRLRTAASSRATPATSCSGNTFDGDEFIGGEIVVNKGPHPQAESDFELFCQIRICSPR